MQNFLPALHWIVTILRTNDIPFLINGGLAARFYGSTRPLADIDIAIPQSGIDHVLSEIQPYITTPPEDYRDNEWQVRVVILNYAGQGIDLWEASHFKIFNQLSNNWETQSLNFATAEVHEIGGLTIPVIRKRDLVLQKSKLGRPVDIEDLQQIL